MRSSKFLTGLALLTALVASSCCPWYVAVPGGRQEVFESKTETRTVSDRAVALRGNTNRGALRTNQK